MTKNTNILVISDVHLSKRFDQKKFDYLSNLISKYDKVIINGDFWDYYWFTNFDDFINSNWKHLFPILLKKDTIYINGNHDSVEKCDDRVKLFSVFNANKYDLTVCKNTYHFEHGNRLWQKQKKISTTGYVHKNHINL